AGIRSGAVGGGAGSPGAGRTDTSGALVSGELISTRYVPGGSPLACGTWYLPSLIIAAAVDNLPDPAVGNLIDPSSSGAPFNVTFPSMAKRSPLGPQPNIGTRDKRPSATEIKRAKPDRGEPRISSSSTAEMASFAAREMRTTRGPARYARK